MQVRSSITPLGSEAALCQDAEPDATDKETPIQVDPQQGTRLQWLKRLRSWPWPFATGKNAKLKQALRESQDLQRAIEASRASAQARLGHVMELYQAKIQPVQADGNCQFRALSAQLYGDEKHHSALRAQVVEQLRCKRERYEPYIHGVSYDDYLTRMARDAEWGDNVSLQAASDALGCPINVFTDTPGSEIVELRPMSDACSEELSQQPKERRPICLTFLTEVHYDAAVIGPEFHHS